MQRFIFTKCHLAMKYLFLLTACVLLSCKKDRSCESCIFPGSNNYFNAKIVWTGPLETDGCNWAIVINNIYYHPDTLALDLQRDQLNVIVSYQATQNRFICGIAGVGFPVIHITNIRI